MYIHRNSSAHLELSLLPLTAEKLSWKSNINACGKRIHSHARFFNTIHQKGVSLCWHGDRLCHSSHHRKRCLAATPGTDWLYTLVARSKSCESCALHSPIPGLMLCIYSARIGSIPGNHRHLSTKTSKYPPGLPKQFNQLMHPIPFLSPEGRWSWFWNQLCENQAQLVSPG